MPGNEASKVTLWSNIFEICFWNHLRSIPFPCITHFPGWDHLNLTSCNSTPSEIIIVLRIWLITWILKLLSAYYVCTSSWSSASSSICVLCCWLKMCPWGGGKQEKKWNSNCSVQHNCWENTWVVTTVLKNSAQSSFDTYNYTRRIISWKA